MMRNIPKILTQTVLASPATARFIQNGTCSHVKLLYDFKSRTSIPRRHYSDQVPGKRIMKHDERTQLHLSIVNDPKLTPRQKHVMVTALMADVQCYDEEYGKLVYADPQGKDLLQFIKTRKKIPVFGIPTSFAIAYFLPLSVYSQAAIAIFMSLVSLSDYYRIMRGMRRRIFFIYFEPQHQVYTALTLTGINDFDPVHFKEEDVQPDRLAGPHKVFLHDKIYSAYNEKSAFINDWFFEKIWKEKADSKNTEEEKHINKTQQNMTSGE